MRKLETVTDLLDAIREERGWSSDNQLAKGLGLPQPTVSNWRAGTRTPGGDHALKIAEALEVSPLLVIAIAEAERAKNGRSKKIWQLVAREISEQLARGTVTAFGALAVLAASYPEAADAVRGVCILRKIKRRPQEALQPG